MNVACVLASCELSPFVWLLLIFHGIFLVYSSLAVFYLDVAVLFLRDTVPTFSSLVHCVSVCVDSLPPLMIFLYFRFWRVIFVSLF